MATIVSNGTGGGDWSVGSTWQGGVAPSTNDTVLVLALDTVNINHDAFTLNGAIHELKIGGDNGANITPLSISWNSATDTFTKEAHGLYNGTAIKFPVNPPTGMTAITIYYVKNRDANTFQISTTYNGTTVGFTGTDAGTTTYQTDFSSIVNYGILNVAYDIGIPDDIFELSLRGNYDGTGEWKIGDSTNRLLNNRTFKVLINYSLAPAVRKYNLSVPVGGKLSWYGANKSMDTTLTAISLANNSNKVIEVAGDITAWRTGDIIALSDELNKSWIEENIIASITGQSVTLTNKVGSTFASVTGVASTISTSLLTKNAHGLVTGDIIRFSALDATTNIAINTNYYVIWVSTNTFKIALSYDGAFLNAVIELQGSNSTSMSYSVGTKQSGWFVQNMSSNIIVKLYTGSPASYFILNGNTNQNLHILSNVMFDGLGDATQSGIQLGISSTNNTSNDFKINCYKCYSLTINTNINMEIVNIYASLASGMYMPSANNCVIDTMNIVKSASDATYFNGARYNYFSKLRCIGNLKAMKGTTGAANNYFKEFYSATNSISIELMGDNCGINRAIVKNGITGISLSASNFRIKDLVCSNHSTTDLILSIGNIIIENYTTSRTTTPITYASGGSIAISNYNGQDGYNRTFMNAVYMESSSSIFRTIAPSLKCNTNNANRVPIILSGNARTAYVNNNKNITLNCHTIKDILSTGQEAKLHMLYGTDGHGLSETTEYDILPTGIEQVVTMTQATPCVLTLTAHGYINGDVVSITTSGALYTGLTAGKGYFVVNKTDNTFELSLTSGGASIATTGTQSGTHKVAKWESKSINLGTTTSAGFITLELIVTKGASTWNLWIDDLEIVES